DDMKDRRRDVVDENSGRETAEKEDRDQRQVVRHRLHRSLRGIIGLRWSPLQRLDRRDQLQESGNDRQWTEAVQPEDRRLKGEEGVVGVRKALHPWEPRRWHRYRRIRRSV